MEHNRRDFWHSCLCVLALVLQRWFVVVQFIARSMLFATDGDESPYYKPYDHFANLLTDRSLTVMGKE